MKEPIFKNCCCCCDLKVGCCIYVGLSLVASVLELLKSIGNLGKSKYSNYYEYEYGYGSSYSRNYRNDDIPEWTKYLSISICIVSIITHALFFKGVSSNKPSLLKPIIISQSISLLVISIVIIFLLPFLGEAAILVLIIAAIPIGISAYLITCIYSLYVTMKYGPGLSAGHVFVPQVIVQSQMPQNYQLQNVYYTANPIAPSYPPSSAPYPPNAYSPEPYNPNFYQPTSYGPNPLLPNYTVAVNNPMNNGDEKLPVKY